MASWRGYGTDKADQGRLQGDDRRGEVRPTEDVPDALRPGTTRNARIKSSGATKGAQVHR
jgi:hypothetical protein